MFGKVTSSTVALFGKVTFSTVALFGKVTFSTVALFGKVTLAKLKDVVVAQERMLTQESELQKAQIVAPFRISVLEIVVEIS